jgi:L-lactate dehydrogenase
MKIAIIGCGDVGSTLAYLMTQKEFNDEVEIMLFNRNHDKALGCAIDLNQSRIYYKDLSFSAYGLNDLKLCKGTKVIIITLGQGLDPAKGIKDRNQLVVENSKILMPILNELKGCKNSIFLIITNPVDNITYLAYKYLCRFSIPPQKIIGLGTMVETARYRSYFVNELNDLPRSLQKTVFAIGEHGDSVVLITSFLTHLGIQRNSKLSKYFVRKGAQLVRQTLGSGPKYLIALCAWDVIRTIINNNSLKKEFLTVSSYIKDNQYYGIKDVCISLPAIIGSRGIEKIVQIPISPSEKRELKESSQKRKKELQNLKKSLYKNNKERGKLSQEQTNLNNLIISLCE